MDEIDLQICQLLMANSRLPQRDIADKLGIGVAIVHRRMQSLVDQGVIKGFTASISRSYLGAVGAQLDGVCECAILEGSLDQLKKNGSVSSVLTSAANLTSLTLILRSIEDLGPTAENIAKILKMSRPSVTISMKVLVGTEPLEREFTGDRKLTQLDYRIINALHQNARKPIIDLADEINITPKTARYHLEMMEQEGSVQYELNWDPARTAGATFIVRIGLKPGCDRTEFINQIKKRYGATFILTFIHSNIMDQVCGYCWAPTVGKHSDLITSLKSESMVADVRSGIVHDQWSFETWRDTLLRERASKVTVQIPMR
ncbi:MAG: HTH-type transcriptional regulator Ptr1 [Methanomassiliicoccales archaeon PtaU1.Bin124]|nr:MAG: HTH-type transcriptional regulator Ptr1 [Methanomassiliicoccales archaeon PtaU1.Bin124]